MPDDKTVLCVRCRTTFSDEEIEKAQATCCLNCGSNSVPADLRKQHTITLTDHELRIIFIWADNWEHHFNPDNAGTIKAIIEFLRKAQPDLPALTIMEEVKNLAKATGLNVEIMDGSVEVKTPPTMH